MDEYTEFEMTVAGYQFPHIANEPYDSDWLNIQVNVRHPCGSWSKTDACLLTSELADQAAWHSRIAEELPPHSEIGFMEPEQWFEWFGEGRNVLGIYLDYSLRPEWSPNHGPNEEEELFVEFTDAAATLSGELERFPCRVKI